LTKLGCALFRANGNKLKASELSGIRGTRNFFNPVHRMVQEKMPNSSISFHSLKKKSPENQPFSRLFHYFPDNLAERGGFEPPVPVTQYDSLANCWFQPLTHLSRMIVERMINRIKRAPLFRVRQKYKIKSQSQNYGFKI
jgi:hypothetical protein